MPKEVLMVLFENYDTLPPYVQARVDSIIDGMDYDEYDDFLRELDTCPYELCFKLWLKSA